MKSSLLIVFALCCSCASWAKAHKLKGEKAGSIDSLVAFMPVCNIAEVSVSDEPVYNDSLTAITYACQVKVMRHFAEKMRLRSMLDISDSSLSREIKDEITWLFGNACRKTYLEDLTLPRAIDSVLSAIGARYALLVLNAGFVRTDKNFKKERTSRSTTALLSLGIVNIAPLKSGSTMYAMIIDRKDHKTCYYNADAKTDFTRKNKGWSPTDYVSVYYQYKSIFFGFYWFDPSGPFF